MLRSNLFKKYKNGDVFVETGSLTGDGVLLAIEAGFKRIISIELSDKYYNFCKNKFKDNLNVEIYKGDSCEILYDIISNIEENITFWLDGHYSAADTAFGKYESPLIYELEQIKNHKIKNHTIIIDDMRCWSNEFKNKLGFDANDVVDKCKEINENYTLFYDEGYVPNDVLICKI